MCVCWRETQSLQCTPHVFVLAVLGVKPAMPVESLCYESCVKGPHHIVKYLTTSQSSAARLFLEAAQPAALEAARQPVSLPRLSLSLAVLLFSVVSEMYFSQSEELNACLCVRYVYSMFFYVDMLLWLFLRVLPTGCIFSCLTNSQETKNRRQECMIMRNIIPLLS